MKRFWKTVSVVPTEGGWSIELDGRPIKTPARELLVAPTEALAQAIADEWSAVDETIDPRAMPLTGLANAAIDRVAPDRTTFAAGLAKYAEADLACYRADTPQKLVDRQAEQWDALLSWARRRFDVDFVTTSGITHVPQPQPTIDRLSYAVAALGPFQLAGLSPLVTTGGSLIAALGVFEGAFTPDQAWEAVSVDDCWQLEQWGADEEAETALENRRADFVAAARFLELLSC